MPSVRRQFRAEIVRPLLAPLQELERGSDVRTPVVHQRRVGRGALRICLLAQLGDVLIDPLRPHAHLRRE